MPGVGAAVREPGEELLEQRGELRALVRGQRCEHRIGRGAAAGERAPGQGAAGRGRDDRQRPAVRARRALGEALAREPVDEAGGAGLGEAEDAGEPVLRRPREEGGQRDEGGGVGRRAALVVVAALVRSVAARAKAASRFAVREPSLASVMCSRYADT